MCIQVMHDDLKRLGLTDGDSGRVQGAFNIVCTEIGKWPTSYMIKENLPRKKKSLSSGICGDHFQCSWETDGRACRLFGTISESSSIGGRSGREPGIFYCLWHYRGLSNPGATQDKKEFLNFVDEKAALLNMDKELLKHNLPLRPNVWRFDKEKLWFAMMGFEG